MFSLISVFVKIIRLSMYTTTTSLLERWWASYIVWNTWQGVWIETTNKAKSICPRLSTRQCKPLTRGGVERVRFRDETPRESDWGCQLIPWPLYTIILYVHVGIESTDTVQGRHEWRLITWCNRMSVAEWKRSIEHVWCACVWQHSHAQHGNEGSKSKTIQ